MRLAAKPEPEGSDKAVVFYRCYGQRPDGVLDWRDVRAATWDEAAAQVLSEGWLPLDVHVRRRSLLERLQEPLVWQRSVTGAERVLLTERLAILLEAGLPIDRALTLLHRGAKRIALRAVLGRVLTVVRTGGSLARALRAEAASFPSFYIGVVEAGERSGRLAAALRDLSVNLKTLEQVRQQTVSALIYPLVVVATSVMALLIVLTGVLPQFEPLFAGEEHRLPLLTQVMMAVSGVAANHGGTLAAMALAAVTGLWVGVRLRLPWLLRLAARLPGQALRHDYLAGRTARVLGMLAAHGIALIEAVALAREAAGSVRWQHFLREAELRLREGARVVTVMSADGMMPVVAVELIEVGEESGQLGPMLLKAAEILELETRVKLDRLISLLPTIAILVLGGLVAVMILSVMLGIFSINTMVLQ